MTLTKATFSMVNGAFGSVLDYGADATGVSDSSAAFTSALADNDRVYVPAGTYRVKDIYLAGSKVLFGDGMESSVLKASGNCTHGVLYAGQPFTRIQNIGIDGNKSSYTANGFVSDGTLYSFANFCQVLDSVQITNCSGYGIYQKGGNALSVVNSRVTSCDNSLVYLDSSHKYLLLNNDFEISSSIGVEVVSVTPHGGLSPTCGTIQDNWFEDITAAACISVDCYNQHIVNNKFNSTVTTTALVLVKSNCDNVCIEHNNFQNGPTNKIQVNSGAVNTKIAFNRGCGLTNGFTTFGISDSGTSTCIEASIESKQSYAFRNDQINLIGTDIQLLGKSGSSSYSEGRLRIGSYYFWVDSSGRLRIKATAPTSDTDGTIVGTQS